MVQELNSHVSGPNLRILDEKSLYLSGVTRFVGSKVLLLLHFHRIAVTDTDSESTYHAGEELIVGKNKSVNPNVLLGRC